MRTAELLRFLFGFVTGVILSPVTAIAGSIVIAYIAVPIANLLHIKNNNELILIIYVPYIAAILGEALVVRRIGFLHGFLVALPLPAIFLVHMFAP